MITLLLLLLYSVTDIFILFQVTKYWSLSDELCDAWVAFDVMACTASILNLTAISVDRYVNSCYSELDKCGVSPSYSGVQTKSHQCI